MQSLAVLLSKVTENLQIEASLKDHEPYINKLKFTVESLCQNHSSLKPTANSLVTVYSSIERGSRFNAIKWPVQLPDLNSIENISVQLKQAIKRRRPCEKNKVQLPLL